MGWERRGNHWYYYKKIRDGDQVRSEYCFGGDNLQEINLKVQQIRQKEKEAKQQQRKEDRQELDQIEQDFQEIETHIQNYLSGVLIAHGYHRHKGQWRKQRDR